MGRIEGRAFSFAKGIVADVNHPDKNGVQEVIRLSYIRGAEDEREELARWRDPKDELPTDDTRVIVRAILPNRAEFITGGWYGTSSGEQGWNIDIDDRFPDLKVVGWRPIMSIEK